MVGSHVDVHENHWTVFQHNFCLYMYSGAPLNGHPSTADTHDIMDNFESPDCPSIRFNT